MAVIAPAPAEVVLGPQRLAAACLARVASLHAFTPSYTSSVVKMCLPFKTERIPVACSLLFWRVLSLAVFSWFTNKTCAEWYSTALTNFGINARVGVSNIPPSILAIKAIFARCKSAGSMDDGVEGTSKNGCLAGVGGASLT